MLIVQHVSKRFDLYPRPIDRLWETLWPRRQRHQGFWAVRDADFSLARGECLGLIGPNGCGKSTLLQVVSGILPPTYGRVLCNGRIAALLELGAGFNPEFTGRENVRLNGELMGLSRAEVERVLPFVERFAEIGSFFDRPVKEYSSGMQVRLAFASAIHVEPDVLIVDEALAVGDAAFSHRCIRKMEELRAQGITILFVSHDLGLVKRLCDRAIFLHTGRMVADGAPSEVVKRYVAMVQERTSAEDALMPEKANRHGDGSAEILDVSLYDSKDRRVSGVTSGEPLRIAVHIRAHAALDHPMVGILLRDRLGMEVYGTNTTVEDTPLGSYAAGDEFVVSFVFPALFAPQQYSLTVAVQHADGLSQDWRDDTLTFTITGARRVAGVLDVPASVQVERVEKLAGVREE